MKIIELTFTSNGEKVLVNMDNVQYIDSSHGRTLIFLDAGKNTYLDVKEHITHIQSLLNKR